MLRQLIIHFWRLSLLKESPDHTPYSQMLLIMSGIVLCLVMIIQWTLSDLGLEISSDLLNTAMTAISLVLSYLVYNYAVLFFRGLKNRWVQTSTSIFCTHAIIHILASPLVILAPYLSIVNVKDPMVLFLSMLYLLLTLALSVWQFVVTAHIYKFALNTTGLQSVLVSFGLIATNILTVSFWR